MKIIIDIPDEDIPKKQDVISIALHFIDGQLCECDYPAGVINESNSVVRPIGTITTNNIPIQADTYEGE